MKKYNTNNTGSKDYPNRRSIRLKGYDYSQAGLYFITICVKNRECLFGEIKEGEMILNDAGEMVKTQWLALPKRFKNIQLYEYVVMPNHFHAILEIIPDADANAAADVRADPCVCPNNAVRAYPNVCPNNANQNVCPNNIMRNSGKPKITGEHVGSPLHVMVQWFKTMTTNEYIRGVKNHNWKRFNGKLWQRNYWEHIIRNDKSYNIISDYIIDNPIKWKKDKFFNSDR